MNPAFSVILLTTCIGAGQGLLLAIYGVEVTNWVTRNPVPAGPAFFVGGSALTVCLCGFGLLASFFHLGRPERAWRAAAMWRTSWLSREVIVLPAFIAASACYGLAHYLTWPGTLQIGGVASLLCLALYICTGMIYACIKFLQEWSSPLTIVNYFMIGIASGCTLAAAFSVFAAPDLAGAFAHIAVGLTLAALATRAASLLRNAGLRPKSTLQTAIGIRHPKIVQKSQGFMGGSFNTREFFHGKTKFFLRNVKWLFLLTGFLLPAILLLAGSAFAPVLLPAAFVIQFIGMQAERWYFFAEANHPQNLYYQAIS
jgi:sulfite dehydrogenase (quinone) subunit SoeC